MLRRLYLKNVALVGEAELEFSEGLNVLTGETGAGKSVILDSIDFVLGAKADKTMVRTGEEECLVRAEFETASPAVRETLVALDIEPEETVVISRRLTADGRSSLKLNGCSVSASMLRRVTSLLVDVHGQSEHFFLLKESNQLKLLDSVAGKPVSDAKSALSEVLALRKGVLADLGKLGGDEGERNRRLDILKYQIDEIERVGLKEGEEEQIAALRTRFQNAERIASGLSAAEEGLISDGSGVDAVRTARRALLSVAKYEPACGELAERLEAAEAELSDIAESVQSLADQMSVDEREAERIEARYDEIRALKKKYGADYAAIQAFYTSAKEEYDLLSESGERFEALSAELSKLEKEVYAACVTLTKARKAAASDFTGRVVAELKTLNIPSARFEVSFEEYGEADTARATSEGLGRVCFLFSPNAGEPLKELGKIISGGEMSRFMLAVKAQLSSAGGIGTYLFDEIDAGIGGKTARVVAEKFVKISKDVQLIAVTHLAQIACFADREFLIEKVERGEKTYTTIKMVEGEARLNEIARLVGGESEHVRGHAQALLEEAEAYKKQVRK